MESMISEGVMVRVETFYQKDYSNPAIHEFMFAYRITIENHNTFPIQLRSRHWWIFDSEGNEHRDVEGSGVVGMQPVISAGEEYQYVSGCNLHSEIGRMNGIYHMENLHTKQFFDVHIPKFDMVAPQKLN